MLEPRKFDLQDLLKKDIQFQIPKYQRAYDWKADTEVKDLISDIESSIKSKNTGDLFLGMMIVDVSKEKDEKEVEVIDGQQRLTTLFILTIALRNYARDVLENQESTGWLQSVITGDSAPFSKKNRIQLIPSESIVDVYNRMCGYDWGGDFPDKIEKSGKLKGVIRQNKRIKPIYKHCYSEIDRICDGKLKNFQKLTEQIFDKTFIIKIDIEDKAEAFEIFERTNARGRSLEISDLLKNYLFSKERELEDTNITSLWQDITENAGVSILRMLKYFWISRNGHVTSRDLYRELRNYANKIGIKKFVNELLDFSQFYSAYFSTEEAKFTQWLYDEGFKSDKLYIGEFLRACGALKIFGVTQTVPIIYSAVICNLKEGTNKKNSKALLSLLRLLESYHFINNKICNRVGNEVEKLYSDFSAKFYNSDSFISIFSDFKSILLSQIAKRDQFIADMQSVTYEQVSDRVIIRYIFDKIENKSVKAGARVKFLDYYDHSKKIRALYDIEHILSQSSKKKGSEDSYIDEIGNLMIFPKQINGILQDKPFKEKMRILDNPNNYKNDIKHVPDYIKKFVHENNKLEEWSSSEISERTKLIASELYDICVNNYTYK